jgi:hypothetical protein
MKGKNFELKATPMVGAKDRVYIYFFSLRIHAAPCQTLHIAIKHWTILLLITELFL